MTPQNGYRVYVAYAADTRRLTLLNVRLTLVQRRSRWATGKPTDYNVLNVKMYYQGFHVMKS